MDKSTIQNISISQLEMNEGQLAGLPANPREILDSKFEQLKQNIMNYPEYLKYNTLKVYPLDNGNYIIIGGNMRYRALTELGYTDIPCAVLPKETSIEQLKAYTILDNNGFGKWDWDMLANEWNADDLDFWGLDIPHTKEISESDDISEKIQQVYKIEIDCADEIEQERIYNELTEKGMICRILTF